MVQGIHHITVGSTAHVSAAIIGRGVYSLRASDPAHAASGRRGVGTAA